MNFFSQNITELRKARKMTQEEVAASLEEKLSTYQAWEEGRNKPRADKLTKICQFFEYHDIYRLLTERITLTPSQ
jgi:transcriptional regulator with XRE-family HTH domain